MVIMAKKQVNFGLKRTNIKTANGTSKYRPKLW